jgi:hypothetical protein
LRRVDGLGGGRDDLITSVKRNCFVSPFSLLLELRSAQSRQSTYNLVRAEWEVLRSEEDALFVRLMRVISLSLRLWVDFAFLVASLPLG